MEVEKYFSSRSIRLRVDDITNSTNRTQGTRIQKTVNMAKSIVDISGQASLLVSILEVPSNVPSSVSLDPHSNWHTSALVTTAVETITLPARLRVPGGRLSTMSEMEKVLRSHGQQNIAQLRLMPGSSSSTTIQDSESGQEPNLQREGNVHDGQRSRLSNSQRAEELEIKFAPVSTQRKQNTANESLTRLKMSRAKSGPLGLVEEEPADVDRLRGPGPAHRRRCVEPYGCQTFRSHRLAITPLYLSLFSTAFPPYMEVRLCNSIT